MLSLEHPNGKVEVWLAQRPKSEPAYPGMYHAPGSAMRSGEQFEDVFARLEKKEFRVKLLTWRFITNVNNPGEKRGHFLSIVYLCRLPDEAGQRGNWFPVDQLPDSTVDCHREKIIPVAVQAFLME